MSVKEKSIRKFFIGVDSDGTAFDTMAYKHKRIYIPQAIAQWQLEDIQDSFREVAEKINLYSLQRGTNRFPALADTFSELRKKAGIERDLPDEEPLRRFVASGLPLSNEGLKTYLSSENSIFLRQVLAWSERCNRMVKEQVEGFPPFKGVRETLEAAERNAEIAIISATTSAALHQEWESGGILQYVSHIAGQELGTKKQQLENFSDGRYPQNHMLLIGDAPGDMEAAHQNGVLFYPILPKKEEESWDVFRTRILPAFLEEKYDVQTENILCSEFLKHLEEGNFEGGN